MHTIFCFTTAQLNSWANRTPIVLPLVLPFNCERLPPPDDYEFNMVLGLFFVADDQTPFVNSTYFVDFQTTLQLILSGRSTTELDPWAIFRLTIHSELRNTVYISWGEFLWWTEARPLNVVGQEYRDPWFVFYIYCCHRVDKMRTTNDLSVINLSWIHICTKRHVAMWVSLRRVVHHFDLASASQEENMIEEVTEGQTGLRKSKSQPCIPFGCALNADDFTNYLMYPAGLVNWQTLMWQESFFLNPRCPHLLRHHWTIGGHSSDFTRWNGKQNHRFCFILHRSTL